MMIKLVFVDGASMTYDEKGILQQIANQEGNTEEVDIDDVPTLIGLWHAEDKITVDWEDVIEQMDTMANFLHPSSILYLDNGQVIDEGQVVDIIVNGESILSTGGCDTSGWEGTDDNVYCEDCAKSYVVKADEYPRYCGMCASESLILREEVEEDISAMQSELAREASKKIRSEAPWILDID